MTSILTPCVKICMLDRESKICTGCGRTVGEIGTWMNLSDQARQRIMDELPTRLAQLSQAPSK